MTQLKYCTQGEQLSGLQSTVGDLVLNQFGSLTTGTCGVYNFKENELTSEMEIYYTSEVVLRMTLLTTNGFLI